MRKESTESRSESRPEWEQLEDWVRSQVQRLIQELLEEEVTEFLGRAKSALRSDSDSRYRLSERIRQSPEAIPYAPTRTEAERLRTVFTRWCGDHSYEAASEALERDWDRMVTFYDFPKEHWGHLRTTNPVESPFAALRLRTDAAKRYKRVDRAIAVIWKMLMVAEQRFRRLKAPELIEDVYLGAQYADGIAIESTAEKVAA